MRTHRDNPMRAHTGHTEPDGGHTEPDRGGSRPRRRHAHLVRNVVVVAGAVAVSLGAWAGAAIAASGGGFSPYQQGCQPGDSDWATPNGETYANCHNIALNVESGGTTQGNANNNNTRYVSYGDNQTPVDPNSQGTPTPYSLGEPGYTGSPHSGCLAINTDGTGGGPAPTNTKPESPGQAEQSKSGCGNNPRGAGFEANYDYYQYYCPIAATLGFRCEDTTPGTTTLTPDTGSGVAYKPIVDNGVLIYYGMDDNTDNGEHDGLGPYSRKLGQRNYGAVNGPSDGGAVTVSVTPMDAGRLPTLTQPESLANLSLGSCADGICEEATTQRQTVYHGCGAADSSHQARCDKGTPQNANVYDYAPNGNPANDPSVYSESPNCNSGDAQTSSRQSCGNGGMDSIRSATPANENAEPGVQVYSDPDSQRSPAAPAPFWPTPGLYVGTCGVYAGSPATTGQVLGTKATTVGGMQVTNAAGQVAIDPQPSTC
jgi:hypothetical protein